MPDNRQPDREHLSLDEIEAREQEEKKQNRPRFNLFNRAYADGAGVERDEIPIADNPTLPNFFKLVGRKINELLTVNIIYVLGNFPVFFFLLAMSGYFSIHTTSPYYAVYAPLRGAMLFRNSPAVAALWTLYGRQAEITVHTTADKILLGLAFLLFVTYGPVRVGLTRNLRNMFRGKPVMMLSDFFEAIRRNWKQALLVGILDLGIVALLAYDITFFRLNYSASMMMSTLFFLSCALLVLYFLMRPYLYLMLVTFDITVPKMFKNALYFTVLGLKRNVMVLIGTLLALALEYALLLIYFPLGVIVPFVILPAFLMLMGVYGAYPKIKEIMIDPYYSET